MQSAQKATRSYVSRYKGAMQGLKNKRRTTTSAPAKFEKCLRKGKK